MIGPQIPKSLREQRSSKKKQLEKPPINESKSDSESSSDEEDIQGPQLPTKKVEAKEKEESAVLEDNTSKSSEKSTETTESKSTRAKPTLLELHQRKTQALGVSDKNRIHKFDHAKGLNDEVKKEILRNVNAKGGLSGRFTKGSG